ncbi:MAG: hypothetical protein ABI832_00390 [bacterium]
MDDDRDLAARFFNQVWALLDKADRSTDDDLSMIHLAHASRLHWQLAGGPREWAIGEWQIARVYSVLGRGEPALFHARVALDLTADGALGAFLAGSAEEVMARACRAAGRAADAQRHHAAALALADQVSDAEEREVLMADLAAAPQG